MSDSRVVYKYPLSPWAGDILLPQGAEVLSVAAQQGEILLYAAVNPHAVSVSRQVVVVGTGMSIDIGGLRFIGTVNVPADLPGDQQLYPHGMFFHVFVGGEGEAK